QQLDEQGRVHTRTPGMEEQQAQDYFPGQLLLALATHPVDDDGKKRIGRALRRYVSRWQAQQTLGPVSWLMQALAAWSVLLEDRALARHCISLGEWIMRWQLRSSGGFITAQQDDTPGFTTGVYLEGLAAAWCNGLVPAARRKVWRGALEQGLAFLDSLSLGAGDAPILPNADFAHGGVCHGPHRPLVRLDYTSHALGAVLDLLE
ncbi:MAG TPA: hypothetical protein PKW90_20695, partial [Myxococcota bacterium]|nr:hypothetical protein [Myxococcota bacterium]